MLGNVRLVPVSALVLTAAASGELPALERFHDVLPAQDFGAPIHAVAVDFDLDGDVDVAAGGPFEQYPLGKRLWLNDGDAVFTESAGAFPMELHPQPSQDLLAADLDGDGLPEVFESRSPWSDLTGDALFHNLGGREPSRTPRRPCRRAASRPARPCSTTTRTATSTCGRTAAGTG